MKDIYLFLILVPSVLIMNVIAYYLFIPDKYKYKKRKINETISATTHKFSFLSEILPYLLLVAFAYIFVKSQWSIVTMLGISQSYALADYILDVEGNIVSFFQIIASPFLTYVSSFIYLIGFPFLLTFTFVILLFTRQVKALQEYAIAITIAYMLAFFFYTFTPVAVTGHTLPDVVPLLYNLSPIINDGLRSLDPFLNRCFPSLHAGLSFLAMLFIIFKTDIDNFKPIAIFITIAIQFTIFYLGIHWILDFIAGVILAGISFYTAEQVHKRISNFQVSYGKRN